jgi:DNA repair protein RadC
MRIESEEAPVYGELPSMSFSRWSEERQNTTVKRALEILHNRLCLQPDVFDSPKTTRDYLTLKLAELEHEVFVAIWLTAQNRLIAYEELFRGTLTQTSVYPREVLKAALKHNAGAVIFAHNHPSGVAEPSRADEVLTTKLKNALAMVKVRVLDHIIVGGTQIISFAERGLI